MIAIDTSVAVAAFASWHELHGPARALVDAGVRLIAHCGAETHSVLTRLPPPHRAAADVVRDYLGARFPEQLLQLPPAAYRRFLHGLGDQQLRGGATYDALVAATAFYAGAELASCDLRALPIYERYGVRVRMLRG